MKKVFLILVCLMLFLVPMTAFAAGIGMDPTVITARTAGVELNLTPYIVGFSGDFEELKSTDALKPDQMYMIEVSLRMVNSFSNAKLTFDASNLNSNFYQIHFNDNGGNWVYFASNQTIPYSIEGSFSANHLYKYRVYFKSDNITALKDLKFSVTFDPRDITVTDTEVPFIANSKEMMAIATLTSWLIGQKDATSYIECIMDSNNKITNVEYFSGTNRYVATANGLQQKDNPTSVLITSGDDYNDYISLMNTMNWNFNGGLGYLNRNCFLKLYTASYCVSNSYTICVQIIPVVDNPVDIPQTGDASNIAIPICMFMVAAAIGTLVICKKKLIKQ